jgi:hypothetical protein
MSRSANVLSVQTLKDFKVTMINFAEEARNSLSGVDMELRRMRDWLERDQLGYWQAQVKRRNEEVMEARSELHRRKITQQGSQAVSDAEQKEALREAQRRLRVAEEKVALVKKLIPQLHHAIAEYHSHSQPLGDHLSGGFERSVANLERMTASLDAYLATAVPTAPRLEPAAAPADSMATVGGRSPSGTAVTAGRSDAGDADQGAVEKQPAVGGANETLEPADESAVLGRSA